MPDSQTIRRRLTARLRALGLSLVALLVISAQVGHPALAPEPGRRRERGKPGRPSADAEPTDRRNTPCPRASARTSASTSRPISGASRPIWPSGTSVHHALLAGDPARDLPGLEAGPTRFSLAELTPSVRRLGQAAADLENALRAQEPTAATAALATVLEVEQDFLPRMDSVVLGLEASSRASVERLRQVEIALMLLTLLVLILEAVFVFRPAVEWAALAFKRRRVPSGLKRVVEDDGASSHVVTAIRRIMVFVALAVSVAVITPIATLVDASYYDPAAPRFAYSLLLLAVVASSYASRTIRRVIWQIAVGFFSVLVAYFGWLAVTNGLDALWTVTALVVAAASVMAMAPYARTVFQVWSCIVLFSLSLSVTLFVFGGVTGHTMLVVMLSLVLSGIGGG